MTLTHIEARAAREARKFTQTDIARLLGVSVQTVQRIEYGVRPMPLWYALALQSIAPPKPKGWTVTTIDERHNTVAHDTHATMDGALAHIRSSWPGAAFVADPNAPTLYVLLGASAGADHDHTAPVLGVDFILPK